MNRLSTITIINALKYLFHRPSIFFVPYVIRRIAGQLKSVALIILYLLVFQTMVLRVVSHRPL